MSVSGSVARCAKFLPLPGSLRSILAISATVWAVGLVVLAGSVLDTDRLLTKGVDAAFHAAPRTTPQQTARAPLFDPSAVRLSAWGDKEPGNSDLSMKVGDRISLTGSDGQVRVLEVIESRAIDPDVTRVGTIAEPKLLMVISRDVADRSRLMRFIVEDGATSEDQPMSGRAVHRAL